MKRLLLLGFAWGWSVASLRGEELRWWDVVEPAKTMFAGGRTGEAAGEELEVLRTAKFEEWVEYEDEFVKLRYPKHELIKFEVKKAEGPIEVEGGVCTTLDNSFQQGLHLEGG